MRDYVLKKMDGISEDDAQSGAYKNTGCLHKKRNFNP